jgi:hypothetical protein
MFALFHGAREAIAHQFRFGFGRPRRHPRWVTHDQAVSVLGEGLPAALFGELDVAENEAARFHLPRHIFIQRSRSRALRLRRRSPRRAPGRRCIVQQRFYALWVEVQRVGNARRHFHAGVLDGLNLCRSKPTIASEISWREAGIRMPMLPPAVPRLTALGRQTGLRLLAQTGQELAQQRLVFR